jgi:hypothetical protein
MVEKNIKEGKKEKKEEIVSFNKKKMELSRIFKKRHFFPINTISSFWKK